MRYHVPISVQTLNTNINADLYLTTIYGVRSRNVYLYGVVNPVVAVIDVAGADLASLILAGGRDPTVYGAGLGAYARLHGNTSAVLAGGFQLFVPNTAMNNGVEILRVAGDTDTPFLDMLSHRIAAVLDPTTAQDALTHHTYADWTPTEVWATATPSGLSRTCRWVRIGNTVFWYARFYSADSNATTGLTFTLPSTPGNHGSVQVACSGSEIVSATLYSPRPYVTMSGAETRVQFWSFQTGVDAQAIMVSASGFYEES